MQNCFHQLILAHLRWSPYSRTAPLSWLWAGILHVTHKKINGFSRVFPKGCHFVEPQKMMAWKIIVQASRGAPYSLLGQWLNLKNFLALHTYLVGKNKIVQTVFFQGPGSGWSEKFSGFPALNGFHVFFFACPVLLPVRSRFRRLGERNHRKLPTSNGGLAPSGVNGVLNGPQVSVLKKGPPKRVGLGI